MQTLKFAEEEVQSGIIRLIPCPKCPDCEAYCLPVEDLIVAATYNIQQEVKFWCEKHVSPLRDLLPDVYLVDLKFYINFRYVLLSNEAEYLRIFLYMFFLSLLVFCCFFVCLFVFTFFLFVFEYYFAVFLMNENELNKFVFSVMKLCVPKSYYKEVD